MDLLEADDVGFARRCRLMRDEDGWAMLDKLAGQIQRLGAHIADVADGLSLTAERHPRRDDGAGISAIPYRSRTSHSATKASRRSINVRVGGA